MNNKYWKGHVEVFWVVTLCSAVEGYKHVQGPCCLHLQGEVDLYVGAGNRRGIDMCELRPCVGGPEKRNLWSGQIKRE
jgi:hypothetical protein